MVIHIFFSINGTTGDATFGGTLVAHSGTFGTLQLVEYYWCESNYRWFQ